MIMYPRSTFNPPAYVWGIYLGGLWFVRRAFARTFSFLNRS